MINHVSYIFWAAHQGKWQMLQPCNKSVCVMVSASLWNVLLLHIFDYINIVQDSNVMWKQITKFVPEIVHEEESDMA